ncbi:MAG TPA: glycoside hydrolase family 36 protein [Spirochaetota bacterium]|nr:glycoside hydrolase family 36 protein [Spirochaetota bacterium]
MKKLDLHKETLTGFQGAFCFYDRMCRLNRLCQKSDLKQHKKIRADSLMLVRDKRGITLYGFTTAYASFPGIELYQCGDKTEINLYVESDSTVAAPEKYVIATFATESEALLFYKRELGEHKPEPPRRGWCSWYQYFTEVTAADIEHNLHWLAENRQKLPLDIMQIDMGYCPFMGDWQKPSAAFPEGVSKLASRIKDKGFTPGIWIAPFTAEAGSDFYRQNRAMFYTDDEYTWRPVFNIPPWKALDLSHPDSTAFLEETILFFKQAGFEYFKLDFLDMAVIPRNRYDNSLSSIELYRRALKTVKKLIGSAPLLVCNSVLSSSFDIADAVRINQDTAPCWYPRHAGTAGAREALRTAFTRLFMNNASAQVDADCVQLRNTQTELTNRQVLTCLDLIKAANSAFFVSDRLDLVPSERLERAFGRVFDRDITAVPCNLFGESYPWQLALYKKDRLVGKFVINWDTAPVTRALEQNCFDFYSGREYKDFIKLDPFAAAVLMYE